MKINWLTLARSVPTTAYVIAGCGALLFAAYTANNAHQRAIGAEQALTAQAVHQRDSLAAVLKVRDAKFRVDTVRVFRSITTLDTLIQSRVDTAIVHQTDTVKITVKEATAIQDTLKACRSLVRDCADIQTALRGFIKADSAIIRTLRAQQPSKARKWLGMAISAGAGYAIGRIQP